VLCHGVRRGHHALSRLSRGNSRASEVWDKRKYERDDHARRITKPQCGVNAEEQKARILFRLTTHELEPSSLDAQLLMPEQCSLLQQLYGSGARRMNLELESSKARLLLMIGLAGSKARALRNFALARVRSPRNMYEYPSLLSTCTVSPVSLIADA